ncbi:MAG: hypothetical protein KatS3mg065_0257 [Chloroflexota bacterium]|nr:MAG: hypothetical protein KatS3mg065_0257 [Chloroflexota bacterium]
MSAAASLASLRAMGLPVVTTRDAALRLGQSESATSHLLRRLADAGVVRKICRGLWAIEPDVDVMAIVPALTAPYPSYVSLWSALHAHGMLSQIPRETHAVSLGRSRRISTPLGVVVVHQLAPEVFGGFEVLPSGIALARPAKAVFDLAYLGATHGRRFRHLPELRLDDGYRGAEARAWVARIRSARLRSMTLERVETIERQAALAAGS